MARKLCAVEGCEFINHALGFCRKHYRRYRVTGDPLGLKQRPNGSGTITSEGYVTVFCPLRKRQIGQHRLVMEEMLGRQLEDYENVHHKNTLKHDNRPENLELWVSSQPKGSKVEDLLEWAEWLILIYGSDS